MNWIAIDPFPQLGYNAGKKIKEAADLRRVAHYSHQDFADSLNYSCSTAVLLIASDPTTRRLKPTAEFDSVAGEFHSAAEWINSLKLEIAHALSLNLSDSLPSAGLFRRKKESAK